MSDEHHAINIYKAAEALNKAIKEARFHGLTVEPLLVRTTPDTPAWGVTAKIYREFPVWTKPSDEEADT